MAKFLSTQGLNSEVDIYSGWAFILAKSDHLCDQGITLRQIRHY